MKSNEALGFTPAETHPFRQHTRAGDITFALASRGEVWRAYGYRWHSEQDASREHMTAQMCARGESPGQAVQRFRALCLAAGWPPAPLLEATQDMLDQEESL
jgi:hypothetical protein